MSVEEGDTERILNIDNIIDYLPFYVRLDKDGKPREPKDIKITDIVLMTNSDLQISELSIIEDGSEMNFTDGISPGSSKTFTIRDEEIKVENLQLRIQNIDKNIKNASLVLRYVLR